MDKWRIAGILFLGAGAVLAAMRFRKSVTSAGTIMTAGNSMLEWPFVVPVGQRKLDSRPRKYPIHGVILHHTVTSSPTSTYSVLLSRGVSTHFEIAPDGKVWKYLEPETDVAYHVGQPGFNDRFIGVDLTGPPFTQEQLNVLPRFLQYLSQKYKFPLQIYRGWGFDSYVASNPDKVYGVFAHANVQSNKQDPSLGDNKSTVWQQIVAIVESSSKAYA